MSPEIACDPDCEHLPSRTDRKTMPVTGPRLQQFQLTQIVPRCLSKYLSQIHPKTDRLKTPGDAGSCWLGPKDTQVKAMISYPVP